MQLLVGLAFLSDEPQECRKADLLDCMAGGHVRQVGGPVQYGSWNPNAIFPIWGLSGMPSFP